jgi:hypothetical protein
MVLKSKKAARVAEAVGLIHNPGGVPRAIRNLAEN